MKLFESICYILMGIIVFIGLAVLYLSINVNKDGFIEVNNNIAISVTNDDMSPYIVKNDIVLVENIDPSDYCVTNVIAYYSDKANSKNVVIARIMKIDIENNKRIYTVKTDTSNEEVKIFEDCLIGKWTSSKIPYIGGVFLHLFTQKGFIIGIVLPLACFLGYEILSFIFTIIYCLIKRFRKSA